MATANPDRQVKWFFVILFTGILLGSSWNPLSAQDKPKRVYMYLDYFQTDEDQYLLSELKWRDGKNFKQLAGMEIDFYLETDTSNLTLGSGKTDGDGMVRLDLTELNTIQDTSGFTHYIAQFAGTESFRKTKKSISIKEIDLTLNSEIIDSVKTVTVSGDEKIGDMKVAIEEADIQILVKRLYNDLPLVENSMEDGAFEYEFPNDIPGDALGNLSVIAKITDHDDYGTVETREIVQWGVPVSYAIEKKPRALWSRAPVWIIGAVWIAFIVVWYHYWLAVSKLFRMKKL